MTSNEITERFAALETQAQADRARLAKSERKLKTTWAVSTLAAALMLTLGWHKDAIAQGYGMTLAQAATRISALETKTQDISRATDPNTNQPTVRFSGVNVQIVDGSGVTEYTQSGRGNLIVGYNELRNNGDLRTGSHNLVVGLRNNYSGNGGVVFGYQNSISNNESCVSGGYNNTASNTNATVSGGNGNTASGDRSTVSGGSINKASGFLSSVSGGQNNTASGTAASVSGGSNNTASGSFSSVSGGSTRTAPNQYNWVAGTLLQQQ